MKTQFITNILTLIVATVFFQSCVTKKSYLLVKDQLSTMETKATDCAGELDRCKTDAQYLKTQLQVASSKLQGCEEKVNDLKAQVEDLKKQRSNQLEQVGDLTVLSKSANDNIKQTLSQLERKDKYITLLQGARSKADSINLALAVNLKSVLKEGLDDKDIEIKVDKTVVFINLSDKMLYESGSYQLTAKANEVLGKIAQIVTQRQGVEILVEGYTDNVPIKNDCMEDNWDLSVKRSTSVVRTLQTKFGVNPDRLIAGGRGEYNVLANNDTAEGRSINRRTRIIIMPKLNQFYDLLNPNSIPN